MFNSSVAVATYGSGTKLNWHTHPAGQVLLITGMVQYRAVALLMWQSHHSKGKKQFGSSPLAIETMTASELKTE
jgi:hypothetical protein